METNKTTTSTKNKIKEFEGLKLTKYKDGSGYSIAYGHQLLPNETFSTVTKEQAEELFEKDIKLVEDYVNGANLGLNQNQFDANVSLVFNVGRGAWWNSELLDAMRVDLKDKKKIQPEFDNWVNGTVDGKRQRLENLVKRRAWESKLFFTPVYIPKFFNSTGGKITGVFGIIIISIFTAKLVYNKIKK